ncbi:DUF4397 domain-containing protein [Clostridiaceae bacterium M8S5]|nr:DUF4397 domain-containing protein [Clostridiaceae bacterium M8S5]
MYYNYYDYFNWMIPVQHGNTSHLRLFHASPRAPGVDILLGNKLVASNLRYREFTKYMALMPGSYSLKIYKAGMRDVPIINKMIDISHGSDNTMAIAGELSNLEAIRVYDTAMTITDYKTQIKFVHLVPNAPPVDVILPNGLVLFNDISYKQSSENLLVSPANYTILVRVNSTKQVVLTVPNATLRSNKYYTIYAIGLANAKPGLQAIIALDRASY